MNFNYTQTPCEAFGLEKRDGVLAMELEVEGEGLPSMRSKHWSSHADGSLKVNGVEYVHKGPQSLDQVRESLEYFEKRIVDSGATVYDSERTSVHVHLNVGQKKIKDIISIATAYYMLEPVLMKHCGRSRDGNLFCLPLDKAPGVMKYLQSFVDGTNLNGDTYRYASLNLGAIKKFGSLEVRTMRGYYDTDHLDNWGRMLDSIWSRSGDFKTPAELFDSYYGRQPVDFIAQFLADEHIDVLRSHDGWDDRLDRNHKLLAPFVYENSWDKKAEDFPKKQVEALNPWVNEAGFIPLQTRREIPRPRARWADWEYFLTDDVRYPAFEDDVTVLVKSYFDRFYTNHPEVIEDLEAEARSIFKARYNGVMKQKYVNDPNNPDLTRLTVCDDEESRHTVESAAVQVEIILEQKYEEAMRANQPEPEEDESLW